jgi:hypothetical protein
MIKIIHYIFYHKTDYSEGKKIAHLGVIRALHVIFKNKTIYQF